VGEKKSDPFLMPGGIMPTYGELRVNDNVEESPKPKKSHVEFDSSRQLMNKGKKGIAIQADQDLAK